VEEEVAAPDQAELVRSNASKTATSANTGRATHRDRPMRTLASPLIVRVLPAASEKRAVAPGMVECRRPL
jgi:hypothetical protein